MSRAILTVIALVGCCVIVCLLAAVIAIRWPFVMVAWLLQQIGYALVEITYYLEELRG